MTRKTGQYIHIQGSRLLVNDRKIAGTVIARRLSPHENSRNGPYALRVEARDNTPQLSANDCRNKPVCADSATLSAV